MNAALYYPWIYLKGGAERTILELVKRSRHDWTLYTNHYEPAATFPEFQHLPVVALRDIRVRRTVGAVARAGLTLWSQQLDLRDHDCLMIVSEGLGNLVAARSRVPTFCLCLTPLKIAYDPVTRRRFFRNRLRLHYRLAVALYARLERPAWRRYTRVFCDSHEVMRRAEQASLVERSRLELLYPGVDTDLFCPDGGRDPYFLVPGRIMWSKNIELAIEAFQRFKPSAGQGPFRLVVAGMVDRKSEQFLSALQRQAQGRHDITFIVSPSDGELIRLYQRCHAVIFPSPNEDWGLVPLEAMACGKPVLATDRGGPRESVVDGETGLLRTDQPNVFAKAIEALAQMPPAELDRMAHQARQRAMQFSWGNFAARIDAYVQTIAVQTAGLGEGVQHAVGR